MKLKTLILLNLLLFPTLTQAATPVAKMPASVVTDEDTSVTILLEGSDADVGDVLTFSLYGSAVNKGTVEITTTGSNTGQAVFTPKENYFGTEAYFKFVVTDSSGNVSSPRKVYVTVNSINDLPTAKNVTGIVTSKETPVTIDLKPYVSDVDDTILSCHASLRTDGSQKAHLGSVVMDEASCQAVYTPKAGKIGEGYFKYYVTDASGGTSEEKKVSITIEESNLAPEAESQEVSTTEDTEIEITLSATDEDGDELTYAIDEEPIYGTVSLEGNVATYTPNSEYYGLDYFTFTASDGETVSEAAIVDITIDFALTGQTARTVVLNVDEEYVISSTCGTDLCDLTRWTLIGGGLVGNRYINGYYYYVFIPDEGYTGTVYATYKHPATDALTYDMTFIITNDSTSVDCSSLVPTDGESAGKKFLYGQLSYNWKRNGSQTSFPAKQIDITLYSADDKKVDSATTNANGCYVLTYTGSEVDGGYLAIESRIYDVSEGTGSKCEYSNKLQIHSDSTDTLYTFLYKLDKVSEDLSDISYDLKVESFSLFSSGSFSSHKINAIFHALDMMMATVELICSADSEFKHDISAEFKSVSSVKEIDSYDQESSDSSRTVYFNYFENSSKKAEAAFSANVSHQMMHYFENHVYNNLGGQWEVVADRAGGLNTHSFSSNSIDSRVAFYEGFAQGVAFAVCDKYFPGVCFTDLRVSSGKGITTQTNVAYVIKQLVDNDGYQFVHNVMEGISKAPAIVDLSSFATYYIYESSSSSTSIKVFPDICPSAISDESLYDTVNSMGKKFGNEYALYRTINIFIAYLFSEEMINTSDWCNSKTAEDAILCACTDSGSTELNADCAKAYKNRFGKDLADDGNHIIFRYLNDGDDSTYSDHYFYSSSETKAYLISEETDEFKDDKIPGWDTIFVQALVDSYLLPDYDAQVYNAIKHEYETSPMLSSGASIKFLVMDGSYYNELESEIEEDEGYIKPRFNIASDDADCTHVVTMTIWAVDETEGLSEWATVTGACPEVEIMPNGKAIVEISSEKEIKCIAPMDVNFCKPR